MKPFFKSIASVATFVAAIYGCNAFAQGKGETLKVNDYPGLGDAMLRVAISKGYCEKYGIRCELVPMASSPLSMQALLAKGIDAAGQPAAAVSLVIQRGAKLKVVGGYQMSNTVQLAMGNHIATPNLGKPWPIFMQDLKGKKVGVTARGSSMELAAIELMTKAGLNPDKDVTFVATGGPTTAYQSLLTKQVDAVFTFDPVGSLCEVLQTCKTAYRADTDKQPAEFYATNGAMVTHVFLQEYVEKNPHVIDAFIKALKDGETFINNPANFKESLEIIKQFFKLDMPKGDEVLTQMLKRSIEAGNFRVAIDRNAMQANLDQALRFRLIDKIPPVSELLYINAP